MRPRPRRAALGVVEGGWHGDDGGVDRLAQKHLGALAQIAQQQARDFRNGVGAIRSDEDRLLVVALLQPVG